MLQGFTLFNSESTSIFTTLSQYLTFANFLFAVALIIFIMFFCVRSLTNTKIATFVIVVSFIPFLLYFYEATKNLFNTICYLATASSFGGVGLVFCIISIVMLLFGFRDEELSIQYVHTRFYWIVMVIFGYIGFFLISVGLLGTTPVAQ